MDRITKAISAVGGETKGSVLVASPEIEVVALLMSKGNSGQGTFSYAFDGLGTLDHLKHDTFEVLVIDEHLTGPNAGDVIVRTRMNLVHDDMRIIYVAGPNPPIREFEPFLLEHDRVWVEQS